MSIGLERQAIAKPVRGIELFDPEALRASGKFPTLLPVDLGPLLQSEPALAARLKSSDLRTHLATLEKQPSKPAAQTAEAANEDDSEELAAAKKALWGYSVVVLLRKIVNTTQASPNRRIRVAERIQAGIEAIAQSLDSYTTDNGTSPEIAFAQQTHQSIIKSWYEARITKVADVAGLRFSTPTGTTPGEAQGAKSQTPASRQATETSLGDRSGNNGRETRDSDLENIDDEIEPGDDILEESAEAADDAADWAGAILSPDELTGVVGPDFRTRVEGDETGPAALYLKEISRNPLLNAAQEVELAKQLEAGKTASAELAKGETSPGRREELEALVRTGQEARTRLTESNLRLVVSIARKYIGRGLDFLDLVQEGNIGLTKGVEKYDWRRGYRFSTYAFWWIRQAVSRALAEQGRTIRLPVHVVEQLGRFFGRYNELYGELGRAPTIQETSEAFGMPEDKVRTMWQAYSQPYSLETPLGEDGDSTMGDMQPAIDERTMPEPMAERSYLSKLIDDAYIKAGLTPRERSVLDKRFGRHGGRDQTLAEIGEELEISKERVRQLEASAIRKLRAADVRGIVHEYLVA